MNTINIKLTCLFALFSLLVAGCKKEFLDKKPSTDIVQPNTLDDFQSLLENSDLSISTALNILASDEYEYRSFATWQSTYTATERNSYIWAKDIYNGEVSKRDWSLPYKTIFYANNVLSGLDRIDVTDLNRARWNRLKGWALFLRAYAHYDLVRTYSVAYDASTASTDLGVPLRLSPSISQILPRASVKQTYDQILIDLNAAGELLDTALPVSNRNHPSKVAAYALAARVYLNMQDYINAEINADRCLDLHAVLLDYNLLNLSAATPFPNLNSELLYFKIGEVYEAYSSLVTNTYTIVSRNLIGLYHPDDLRLSAFFNKQTDGTYTIRRNISGRPLTQPFIGLALDEVYLIKSECAARRKDVATSLDFINQLLIKRYAAGKFVPISVSPTEDPLNIILLERQKELVFRSLRWDDIKRLNQEEANIILTRELNGEIFTLQPKSPKYALPIPDNEISLSGIVQNQR